MAITQLQQFTNNATTTVPSTLTSGVTSITVATGTGSLFPTLAGSQYFIATIVNTISSDPGFGQLEIVKVTARSGDVLTVIRGQEGTTAKAFPAACVFELRPTAGAFNTVYTNILQVQTDKADLASPVFTGDPTAPTPTTGDNDTSIATTAFVQNTANLLGYSRVFGQTGINNSGTPNTQYDFAATAVVLRNSAGSTITRVNTGTVTNNVSTAGSTANGRDQAGAFSSSSWIHFYWIWNGTTLATLSSASAPPTAPTLPSGYTHWAYITAIRFDNTSALLRTRVNGSTVTYDYNTGSATIRVLAAGQATVYTAVNCAPLCPPNSISAKLQWVLSIVHNVAGASFAINYRPTGASNITNRLAIGNNVQVANQGMDLYNTFDHVLGTSQQIDYAINTVPSTSGGAYLDILGYTIPNGDS